MTAPPIVVCPNPDCGKSYSVALEYLGRRGRCKSCGTEFVFSAANTEVREGAAAPGSDRSADSGNTGSNQGTTRTGRSSIPTRLGRFKIIERVGMGGFGAVYRAQDPQLHRTVALKLLQSTGDEKRDRHRIDRFLIEGRAGARLQHPHIVPVFDAGRDEETGEYYMAAAFIAGQPLSATIDGKPLDARKAASIVQMLAQALEYAHSQGILHRDVKPDNVMLDDQGAPHLMDFGLARMEESESHLTKDGAVMGTPAYMSPEQCVGKHETLGPPADQYSLGCLLYELLTGEKLFDGPVSVQIHHQINTDAPAPSRKNPAVPTDLDTICLKTLAKEPNQRYASCAALAADLNRWLADEPIQARQLTPWERWNRWRRRNPAIAMLSIGLAAALLIGLIGITTQWRRAEGNARTALQAAEDEKKATAVATAERRATQLLLAESYVQRGRFLCVQEEVGEGLLWMARGLRTLPEGEDAAARLMALRIAAWQPTHPQRLTLAPHEGVVSAVRFGPDGSWFVTASLDGAARIWETDTGRPLSPPLQHGSGVTALDVSPDGGEILSGAYGEIRRWRSADGSPIGDDWRPAGAVFAAVFADGGAVITLSNKSLHFWDEETRQPLREPVPLTFDKGPLITTPDRRTIIVSNHNELITFDAAGNETGTRIAAPGFWELRGLTTTPDGQVVLAAGLAGASRKGLLRAWRLAGERQLDLSHTGGPWSAVNAIACSPDGRWLAAGWLRSITERVSRQDLQRVGVPCRGLSAVRCVAYHPERDAVLTGSDDGAAILWSLPAPERERLRISHPGGVYGVQFSPDGERLLSAGNDGTVRLWDSRTGAAVGQPIQHQTPVWYAVFSPDGRLGASGSGASALIWNAADGTLVGDPLAHPAHVYGVEFSPDNRTLLTGCEDGIARLWNVATREMIAETEKHPGKIWAVAFSRDGARFGIGCGHDTGTDRFGELRVWDTQTCTLVSGPTARTSMISAIQFTNRDGWVTTASGDGNVHIWDAKTSELIHGPLQHPTSVSVVAFDATEKVLVTSCGDGRVRFWDVDSKQQFGPDLVHDDMAVGLSFSPDGRSLATGSLDGTVRIWDVPQPAGGTPDEIERRIQLATGMRLSAAGDLEYVTAPEWLELRQRVAAPDVTQAPAP